MSLRRLCLLEMRSQAQPGNELKNWDAPESLLYQGRFLEWVITFGLGKRGRFETPRTARKRAVLSRFSQADNALLARPTGKWRFLIDRNSSHTAFQVRCRASSALDKTPTTCNDCRGLDLVAGSGFEPLTFGL